MHYSNFERALTLAITPDRPAYPTYDRWAIVIEVSAWVLAISASMILGLLSFSGMLAIWPVLPLAFAAFLFAIVIEGQIYLDNMRSSLEKLSDPKAYEHQLSDLYLQEKLVNYDKNRDLFILNEPTEDNKRRVREHNEVVVFKKNGQYAIGFRNNKGEYEQRDLVDAEQNKFLAHYSKKEQFMESPGHHGLIQNILRSFDERFPDRLQEQYPVLVHAYVSQCRYLRKLNCYLHTQVANEANQNELKNMNMHLTKLSENMSDYLFHDVSSIYHGPARISFELANTSKKLSLDLETMTLATDASEVKAKQKIKLNAFDSSIFNRELSTPALLEFKVAIEDNSSNLSDKTIDQLEMSLKLARSQLIVFSEDDEHRRNERKRELELELEFERVHKSRREKSKEKYTENKEVDDKLDVIRKELEDLTQAKVTRQISRLEQQISSQIATEERERKKLALVAMLGENTYAYHRNKLIEWITRDKADWKKRLTQHTINSRIAFVIAAFSGLIMGIGTTYLIMEAVAVIPWLMLLPLSLFPPVIGPLAVIAGAAYGLLIYNSLTDILLDNPEKKFIDRMRAISSQEMTIKRVLILSLSLVLFLVTIFLTMCTAGTWLTVFHKTKPLVAWLSVIPNVLLNIIIPILIGISVLPFSFQSVS
ncbi:MAG: hypothetical protein NTZ86_02975, partial [Legionellales bacterium]|nr:hypothetical protein [Legionellales bacterium]